MRLFEGVLRNAFALGIPSVSSERISGSRWRRVVCALALLLCAAAASAQVETGQVAGTVTDQSGAVIPGAQIKARNLATNAVRSTQSNQTGAYLLPGLEPSSYEITVNFEGFKPLVAKVEVAVAARITLDAKLSVSSDVTQVEVTAESVAQINTQTQEISQVVDSQQLAELPSLTRNPYDFVAIAGNISNGDAGSSGSSSSGSNSQNSTTRGVGFNINGQRSTGTEILLDGVENIAVFSDGIGTAVPMDAIQEYRVSTSNFEAQFGRASGGVVNVTTRGGTSSYHGSAWEFNRLSAYTSNTETNDQLGRPKGVYTRNQFGFAAGGPIKKDKLFAFGSTEWTRVRSSASLTAGVPTPQFLGAAASDVQDFFNTYGKRSFNFVKTYTASQIYGTDSNNISQVPTGLDPNLPMMGVVSYKAPQNAGGGLPQNTYNFVIRVDYNASEKTSMYGRVVDYHEADQAGAAFASPYSQYDVSQTIKNQAYLYSVSHTFTPALSSSTKLSFSRFNTFDGYNTALQNTPTLVVYTAVNIPGTSVPVQLPGFYDTNPAQGGLPAGGPENTAQINQDVNWLKGKHSIQGGAQLVYIQENQAFGAFAQAEEQLGRSQSDGWQNLYTGNLYQFEAAVDPKGALPCTKDQYTGSLNKTASCMINLPASSPNFARSDRFKDWAVYAQDSWKMNQKLTVNYGVRYEYYGVQHNDRNTLDSNYYYGSGSSLAQRIRNGQVFTVPNSPIHKLWNPTYGAVSPRIGFAYDLTGNGKTSIRGGWGIAYERNFGNVTFNLIQNPPNYAVVKLHNTPVTTSNSGPLSGSTGNVALPPTSLRQVDQDIKTAQTEFWSLAIEHQLNPSTMVSLEYVGARGVHLYDIKNYNGIGSGNVMAGDPVNDPQGRLCPTDSNPNQVCQALTRLNPQYSDINTRGSGADSYYHGANLQFQTRNLHQTGLSVVANYTFSHSVDDLSTTFSETNNTLNLGYTDPFNPRLDRGNGDLDVRQRVVVAPMYEEPYFKQGSRVTRTLLADWRLSGIFQAHTGAPFTYFDSTSNVTGYNIPRYTPAAPITKRTFKSIPHGADGNGANSYVIGSLPAANSWSNPNLLGASDWGPWPANMTGRNSFRGPGMWNLDAVASKTLQVSDRYTFEFRAEGFNVLNHHNLFLQEINFDAAQFGGVPQIIASKGGIGNNGGANDERRFGQFSLKMSF